jgi:hypothetical protein
LILRGNAQALQKMRSAAVGDHRNGGVRTLILEGENGSTINRCDLKFNRPDRQSAGAQTNAFLTGWNFLCSACSESPGVAKRTGSIS